MQPGKLQLLLLLPCLCEADHCTACSMTLTSFLVGEVNILRTATGHACMTGVAVCALIVSSQIDPKMLDIWGLLCGKPHVS